MKDLPIESHASVCKDRSNSNDSIDRPVIDVEWSRQLGILFGTIYLSNYLFIYISNYVSIYLSR
jgi:hypothetical protein